MKTTKLISGGKELLIVTGILRKIGNQKPYFSLTGEIWKADLNGSAYGRDCEACGTLHDEILKAFPGMKDLCDLHLSDNDGVPMYAVENGWYWNGGTKWQEYKRETLASYLRISEDEADQLHAEATTKEIFTEKVEAMEDRWAREAKAAIEKYGLTIES
jgi:hypothetical protein